MVKYLGTIDHGIGPTPVRDSIYHIVSCSNVIEIKRLDKIIDALKILKDKNIIWTHYGDGLLLNDIKRYAKNALPENITVNFRGHIENKNLMKEYKAIPFDIFLTTSESEGIPVSLIEAISFGIPCIATNVGGMKEIVGDKINGILLQPECTNEDIMNSIIEILDLDDIEYKLYRMNARKIWEERFNAVNNYKNFIDIISNL